MSDPAAPGAALPAAVEHHIGQAQIQLTGTALPRADALHEARKSLKRARALLRLSHWVQPSLSRELDGQLRSLAARLGRYRDADAMLEALDRLAAIDTDAVTLQHARQRLITNRDALLEAPPGYRALAGQVGGELAQVRERAGRLLSPPNPSQLRAAFQHSAQALRRGRKNAKRQGDAEAFHSWRKRAKTLLYQSQWLTPGRGGLDRRHSKRLNRLAELLGQHHDLHVLRSLLSRPELFNDSTRTDKLRKLLGKQYRRIEKRVFGSKKVT